MAVLIAHEEKNLGMTIPESANMELGDLTKAINLMSSNLKKSRDDLEARVGERTKELSIANDRLVEEMSMRRATEAALSESLEKFRQVFDQVPAGLNIVKLDQTITETNSEFRTMLGAEKDHIIGHNISRVIQQKESQLDAIPYDDVLKGKIARYEDVMQLLSEENRPFWAHLTVSPIVGGDGAIIYAIVMIKDIDEQVSQAHALRESEDRNKLLVEQSPVGIATLDQGLIVYVNPSMLEIFGFEDATEILGHSADSLFDPESSGVIQKWNDHVVLSSGGNFLKNNHLKGLKKNGESVDLTVWPAKIVLHGRPTMLLFIADRSEEYALRAQLLQAQKMEAVGALSGGIAHDFNNILQSVLGYSELMLSEKKTEEPDHGYLEKIHEAGKRGAALVRNLMLFSRKTKPEFKPINLNHEVEQVVGMLSRTLAKMIQIETILAPDVPTINADPTQMNQVLMNLAINARDAMGDEGKVSIQTSNIVLDESYVRFHPEAVPGHYALLTVSDTGIGMDKETLSHVFEPFFTTKEMGKGTGFGLATVYGIITQHLGFIQCESEPGHGTTFRIFLPAVQTQDQSCMDETEEACITRGTENILVVDDEQLVRDLVRRILVQAGYTVFTASDGQEALNLYKEDTSKYSLVILDLVMPIMGGRRCLQALLNINPEVKVLIATAADNELEMLSPDLGVKGIIYKPYDAKKFLKIIRDIIDGI